MDERTSDDHSVGGAGGPTERSSSETSRRLLAASAGLVIGSALVVAGPTTATRAARTVTKSAASGTSGSAELQRGALKLACTYQQCDGAGGASTTVATTTHGSLPKLGGPVGQEPRASAPVVPFPDL